MKKYLTAVFFFVLFFGGLLLPNQSNADCGSVSTNICNPGSYVSSCEDVCGGADLVIGCAVQWGYSAIDKCVCDDGSCTDPRTNCPLVSLPDICFGPNEPIPPYVVCGGGGGFHAECCSTAEECEVLPGECSITNPADCLVNNGGPCDPVHNPDHNIPYCITDSPNSPPRCICSTEELLGITGDPSPALCEDGISIDSAIGCIPVTETNSFTQTLLGWGLGIGGGIALLVIAIAGIMINTSTGNPQRLQAGRNLAFAGIAGLLLMIFSAFILRFVGITILNIPALGS